MRTHNTLLTQSRNTLFALSPLASLFSVVHYQSSYYPVGAGVELPHHRFILNSFAKGGLQETNRYTHLLFSCSSSANRGVVHG